MPEKLNITDWALEDRPREKLLLQGRQSLTDAELIAILIGSGSTEETAVELAKRILNNVNNNLHLLGKQSISDLMKFKGIGEAKAISIVAALELGRRRKLSDVLEKKQLKASKDVFELMSPILSDLPHEEFWVIFLNRKNAVIDKQKIGQGGIHATSVDLRLIMKAAIEKLAVAIILCHNHPTGNMKASDADIKLTKQIVNAADILEISVLDHLIIGDKKYFSFKDNGLI
ncbi:MAG: DNA repair protein RadC [Bacteroidales bacterium]|nr:DNA repair protein RadC [Bacteroidales bacterium]